MQQQIKIITKGFIALVSRQQGALNTRLYTTAKSAKNAVKRHIEKLKEVREATMQQRKENLLNTILKGASLLNKLGEKLATAKYNLKAWGYSFQRYIIVLKLKIAYNKALKTA